MFIKNVLKLMIVACAITGIAQTSQAALIISYDNPLNLIQGQSGTLDVVIRSTDEDTDFLSLFSARFLISPIVGSGLAFTNPPSDQQYTAPNYIFAGEPIDALGSVLTQPDILDTGDGIFDPVLFQPGIVIVPTSNRLLIRLDLDASLATAGSEFRIFMINDFTTEFLDDGFDPLMIDPSSFTNFGVVNVAAVPEPSTLSFLALLGAGAYCAHRKRRKAAKLDQEANLHSELAC